MRRYHSHLDTHGKTIKLQNKIELNQADIFTLNQILRAVFLHNYGVKYENYRYSGMKNMIVTFDVVGKTSTQTKESSQPDEINKYNYSNGKQCNILNASTTPQKVVQKLIKQIKDEFAVQMLLTLAGNGIGEPANVEDFDILRLLVLTAKFFIECETSFDLHIKCINGDAFSMANIIKKAVLRIWKKIVMKFTTIKKIL